MRSCADALEDEQTELRPSEKCLTSSTFHADVEYHSRSDCVSYTCCKVRHDILDAFIILDHFGWYMISTYLLIGRAWIKTRFCLQFMVIQEFGDSGRIEREPIC